MITTTIMISINETRAALIAFAMNRIAPQNGSTVP